MNESAKWLKVAFLVGAVVDGLAAVAMVYPPATRLVWGFEAIGGELRFAMCYGASLMVGWTLLLAWSSHRPLERSSVALLTSVVVLGLVATEILAAASGDVAVGRMMPLLAFQVPAIVAFGGLYLGARIERARSASQASSAQQEQPQ